MPRTFKYLLVILIIAPFVGVQAQEQLDKDSISSFVFDDNTYKTVGPIKKGTASFYSLKFEGRKTASGTIFSHAKYTAASNHYPLGIFVKVVNPKNNQFVVVKINDRMAKSMAKKGRIVDLTRKAAKELDIFKNGIGKVLVQKVEKLGNK